MSDQPISRRESLKRAAGALALGLGAPAALAMNLDEDGAASLAFYKLDAEEPFHTMRLSGRDAKAFQAVGPESRSYIKFDGVDGEAIAYYGKLCCPNR